MANHAQASKAKDYDPSLEYFTKNFSDSVEEDYYDSKGKFNKIIFDLEHSHALSPTIRHSTMLSTSSSSHNLPPMKIPEFSGKYTEWGKFSCLLMGVHGKAREIVSKYKLSETNYKLAWNDLVSHYENKRHLVNTYMSELLQAKPIKGESAYNLEELKRDIDSPIELLKSLSRPVELWDNFILFLTTSRFADKTLK